MKDSAYWDAYEYDRIESAAYDGTSDMLHVRFANGDEVLVHASEVVRPRVHADWARLEVVEHRHITVPVAPGMGDLGEDTTDVPGFYIRSLTDAEFRAHLARKAEESARRVGQRIRALRQARGLSAKDVATRAGVAQLTMSRIELGRHDAGLATVEKILTAMGYALPDLVTESA